MKKIVITGALGYIGTELCKLYSGFSWKYEIIAIDNRFVSERVNELKRRKIKFVQADILNIDEIEVIMSNVSFEICDGMTIDYVELEKNQFNFIFLNPKDPNYVEPKE